MESKCSPIAWKLEDLAKDEYDQFTENTIAQLLAAAEIVRNHVEVVRCGECRSCFPFTEPKDEGRCYNLHIPVKLDFSCQDGERKDGGPHANP